MLTAKEIVETIERDLQTTEDEVQAILDDIDQNAIYQAERDSLSVEKWDKESPVNGCSAEKILSQRSILGDAYFIKQGGEIVYFQTAKPNVAGDQPIEDALAEGGQHADSIAERMGNGVVIATVKHELTK